MDDDDGRRRRGRRTATTTTTRTTTTTVHDDYAHDDGVENDDEAQDDDDDFPPARRQHRQAVSRNASPAPSPTLRNERGHRQRQVCTRERHVCRDGKRQVCTGWTTSSCGPCECPHDNNSACECQRFGTNVHLCGPPPLHPPALSCGHSQETQEAPDDAPTGRAPEAASTRQPARQWARQPAGRASQRATGTRARGSVYSPASAPTGAHPASPTTYGARTSTLPLMDGRAWTDGRALLHAALVGACSDRLGGTTSSSVRTPRAVRSCIPAPKKNHHPKPWHVHVLPRLRARGDDTADRVASGGRNG